jgi:S-DNA-T family DNA segregation ATPase FtsK/SpoIIIE
VIASVAPLVAALVIWGLTGSVFALVFAGLSPVMAVASLLDGRRTRRRAWRRGAADYAAALVALHALADEQKARLRTEIWEHTPSAGSILAAHEHTAYWPSGGITSVSAGTGSIDGGLRVDGADSTPEHRAVSRQIATLTEAPIVVDALQGIGLVGSLPVTRALARALVIQLCASQPPTRCRFSAPATGWEWANTLPHRNSGSEDREVVLWEDGERISGGAKALLLIAVASHVTALPPGCDTIVRVYGPDRAEIMRSAVHPRGLSFRPELIATAAAGRFAAVLQQQALSAGLVVTRRALPATVALGSFQQNSGLSKPQGLACTIGQGEHGVLTVDLVQNGPHAVVGGTTGSGKSELLVTWILAMAATRSVQEVNFLLVDFKGGAAFGPLAVLPHCVGLVTDLDRAEATRALASLTAELHYRERLLHEAHARSIDERQGGLTLPRLVIVVDEFATMLDAFPDLHALFVDIAARGRSLGVHLILCTQRPAGVVRDALLANCSLRISLRVNNRADSLALLGTDAAASVSPETPGRALVDTGTGAAFLCQIATSTEDDLAAIIASRSDLPPARRPWLQPLPRRLTARLMAQLIGAESEVQVKPTTHGRAGVGVAAPSSAHLTLGMLDEPDHQRYRFARYCPAEEGHLLVLGASRSGKTSALALIEAQAHAAKLEVLRVGADVERAWDLLEYANRRAARRGGASPAQGGEIPHGGQAADGALDDAHPLLLLFDDFDSVLARWEPEHRLRALDLLTAVLRDGGSAGITCVVSVQRVSNGLQLLQTLCPNRLLLRTSNREEYLAAGGRSERFEQSLPPGGGLWQNQRIQLLHPAEEGEGAGVPEPVPLPEAPTTAVSTEVPTCSVIVVAGVPAQSAERFRQSTLDRNGSANRIVELGGLGTGAEHLDISQDTAATVFVGDADAWQGQWALLNTLRHRATMIFDDCSLADFRVISRRRQLPPPLAAGSGHLWVLHPDGSVKRGTLRNGVVTTESNDY